MDNAKALRNCFTRLSHPSCLLPDKALLAHVNKSLLQGQGDFIAAQKPGRFEYWSSESQPGSNGFFFNGVSLANQG